MKRVLVLGLLSLSVSAFAQICEVDLVFRSSQTIRTFKSFGDSNCYEGMKECRKSIHTDYSRFPQYPSSQLECKTRIAQTPVPPVQQPNPYSTQIPYPQSPTPSNVLIVTGIVEDNFFSVSGNDANELFYNCMNTRMSDGMANEIFFTANNNRFVTATSQRLYNDEQICQILKLEASRSTQAAYTPYIRVVGTLEREPFQIQAIDRADLLNQCLTTLFNTRQTTADELTYSLNGYQFQRVTTPGWWTSPAKACRAMIQHLDSQLR